MPEDQEQLISRWYQSLDPTWVLDMSQPSSPDRKMYVEFDSWVHQGQKA